MYIPVIRERVRMQGHAGEFLVLRVDYVKQVADLAAVSDSYAVHENVPFASMFAVFEEAEERGQPQHPERPSGTGAKPTHGAGS